MTPLTFDIEPRHYCDECYECEICDVIIILRVVSLRRSHARRTSADARSSCDIIIHYMICTGVYSAKLNSVCEAVSVHVSISVDQAGTNLTNAIIRLSDPPGQWSRELV